MTFKPIKKSALSKEIENSIKMSLAAGTYKEGEKLPSERELTEQFQVSRVTIREALKNLERGGLISIRRGVNAGAYVSELSADPITDNFKNLIQLGKIDHSHLIHIRMHLDPWASMTAANFRQEEDIEKLTAILNEAEKRLEKSWRQARLVNVSFHLEIARISKNPIIDFITESITQAISALTIEKTRSKLDKQEVKLLIDDHRNILDAIIAQEAKSAYQLTLDHLIRTYDIYSRISPIDDGSEVNKRMKMDFSIS